MSNDDKDKPHTTAGIMATLREKAVELGLEKEFDRDPNSVLEAIIASAKPASINMAKVDQDYYQDLTMINSQIEEFKKDDHLAFLKSGSANIRVHGLLNHFYRHELLTTDEMDDASFGFNQLVTFNLALQEIIDIFPRPESGQIIASLYHVIAFITVSTLCTHRNVPIPQRGIFKVLGMNAPTSNRTLYVLSDGSLENAVTTRYDRARQVHAEAEARNADYVKSDISSLSPKELAQAQKDAMADYAKVMPVSSYDKSIKNVKAEIKAKMDMKVEVEGVKADGSVGTVEVNTRVIGENRLGLITKLHEFDSGTTRGSHLKLTEKGLMLASRIKDILNAKAKWAGKQP